MLQISKEEWDGLVNGTDRATPAYIGVDAALILGSSEGIWLGDLWQELQEWERSTIYSYADFVDLRKIAENITKRDETDPHLPIRAWDEDGARQWLCELRIAIIEKFYEVELDIE